MVFEASKSLNRLSKIFRILNNYNREVIFIEDTEYSDFTQYRDKKRKENYLFENTSTKSSFYKK